MPKIGPFVDARNLRKLILDYARRNWCQDETDEFLQWIGLADSVSCVREDPKDVHVYVLGEDYPGSTLVKVGVSKDPERRLEVIEAQEERNLHVAFFTVALSRKEAMRIERAAHRALQWHRIANEWFSCGTPAAQRAVIAAGGVPDIVFADVI